MDNPNFGEWMESAMRSIGDAEDSEEKMGVAEYTSVPMPVIEDGTTFVLIAYCVVAAPVAVPQAIYSPQVVARVRYPDRLLTWLSPAQVGFNQAPGTELGWLDELGPSESHERREMLQRYKVLLETILERNWLADRSTDEDQVAVAREVADLLPRVQERALKDFYRTIGADLCNWIEATVDSP